MSKKYVNITLEAFMCINPLPSSVDWGEAEKFLIENRYGNIPVSERFTFAVNWEESGAVTKFGLSDNALRLLQCLINDLHTMYYDFHIQNENGEEDRDAEYKFLEDWLHAKYSGLSEKLLKRIYSDYRIMDR